MSDTLIDDPDDHRNPDHVIASAMASRPRAIEDVVVVEVEGGTLVWPAGGPVYVLSDASRAVWPHLDGSTPLGELAEDLADLTDAPLGVVQDYLTSTALDLAYGGLADGMEDLVALVVGEGGEPAEPAAETAARGTFEEVRDGLLHLVTEVDVRRRDLREAVGGLASMGELVPPDSCTGKRLQLDREAEVVSLSVGGTRLAVRCSDASLLEWLRAGAPADDGEAPRGPIVAFVTSDAGGSGPTRHAVYDGDALLIGSTTSTAEVRDLVLGVLTGELELRGPADTAEARLHVLVGDAGCVLAVPGSLARPRGLHRHLRRAGVEVVPTRRVFVSADGRRATVPRLRSLDGLDVVWDEHRVIGSWIRGNRAGPVATAQEVAVLLRDTRPRSAEDRRLLVHSVQGIVESLPVALGYRADISTRSSADDILALFGR